MAEDYKNKYLRDYPDVKWVNATETQRMNSIKGAIAVWTKAKIQEYGNITKFLNAQDSWLNIVNAGAGKGTNASLIAFISYWIFQDSTLGSNFQDNNTWITPAWMLNVINSTVATEVTAGKAIGEDGKVLSFSEVIKSLPSERTLIKAGLTPPNKSGNDTEEQSSSWTTYAIIAVVAIIIVMVIKKKKKGRK